MIPRIDIPPSLITLAGGQGGVFSVAQAERLGLTRAASRRMHRDGHWHRIAPAIWSTAASPSWMGLAWAGVLQCDQGVLGGAAAGHLYGLCPPPSLISVWCAVQLRRSQQQWRFRRGQRCGFLDPPRVRIEDAALEMCEEVSDPEIVSVLARALGTRRTTQERLGSAALRMSNLTNRRLILDVLGDVGDGVESPLEHRYLIDVERVHGLPTASRQVVVSSGTRTDVGYLEFRLLVELDGQLWHEGLAAWSDMDRDNQHQLASFTTLRFGWDAVTRSPCTVASQVARALAQRGWNGELRPCPGCR